MKSLIISLDNSFPIKTDGNLVVYNYDLIGNILYDIAYEITSFSSNGFVGDRMTIIQEFASERKEEFRDFIKVLYNLIMSAFSANSIPDKLTIPFPEGYIDWMRYNAKPEFTDIGKNIIEKGITIAINPQEIYQEYVSGKILTEINKLFDEYEDIELFAIVGVNDTGFHLIVDILSQHPECRYLPYNDGIIQREIGLAYYNGEGISQNYEKALSYFKNGVEKGDIDSIGYIGKFYEEGLIVDQDHSKAFRYYQDAENQGSLMGSAFLGQAYHNGIGTLINIEKAVEYYLPAANGGISMAQERLGDIYYEGSLGTSNYEKSVKWYCASINGNPSKRTYYRLGQMLFEGKGAVKNNNEALKYLKVSATENIEDSCFLCGQILERGNNKEEAISYYKQGSEAEEYKAATEYAIYLKDHQSLEEVIPLLQLGVEKGYMKAQYELASILTDFISMNYSENLEKYRNHLLSLSSEQGYEPAKVLQIKLGLSQS